ncbi:hypothetical protein ABT237_25380, partial [Streptomyces sp. NPDC001581]|uniref:hypothetical protein n=1 Tax=Streptomyces sp. NPDC001581 TaxID=3154386 RepID=UPI00332F01E7
MREALPGVVITACGQTARRRPCPPDPTRLRAEAAAAPPEPAAALLVGAAQDEGGVVEFGAARLRR